MAFGVAAGQADEGTRPGELSDSFLREMDGLLLVGGVLVVAGSAMLGLGGAAVVGGSLDLAVQLE